MRRRAALSTLAASLAGGLLAPPLRAQEQTAAAVPQGAPRRRLLLGQSAPLSGPAAQLGKQMQLGARLFLDALNAAGGINGMTVELKTLDDGYDPERCKANTEKFIDEDVFALFGYVGTPTSLAALPLVNQHKIPFFAPLTGAEALRDPLSRWVFHVRASYYEETALIVKQLAELGLHKISVFHQNDSYGKAGLEGVTRAMKPLSLQPQAASTVERNSVDVAKAVRELLPGKPEAIVLISAYKSCAAFIREARRAGYGGVFYNVSFVGTQALLDELGKDALGVVVSQVMPYPFGTTSGIAAEYQAALAKAGGDLRPDYNGIEGFLAAKVLSEGLRRMGRPSREGLVAALEGLQSFNPGGFPMKFGPTRHTASNFVELSMLTADGKVKR
ncbi:ABC transporter substrate-binding protein [Roseateles violae]|uniref:ABC transporter substrate-binding protein n=1 Tax=Roseateles violae TaxID=3058042 RepID=A0ABT8DY11_9BURK|nr:ABC transporter substrate-binding protein [Pelomonas sp. PFR6]MDN3922429.1 ABC transporter substrate-binding protein [Pelomonas sp. PFR6]